MATLMAMTANLPADWVFSAFSIGRNQLPYAAMAVLAGGNIRVGLEDNIWLGKGELATNGQLVERAATIARAMGSRLLRSEEHTSELQSLMRISYAVFCLQQKKTNKHKTHKEANRVYKK